LNTESSSDTEPSSGIFTAIRTWILVLGAVGFGCGFFGPIVLSPDANQGPLLGIFITGPGGALLGAALGMLVRMARLQPVVARQALEAVAAVLGLTTLYFSLPAPRFYANVLDVNIAGCSAPGALRERAMADWEHRVEEVTWAAPRAGWKEDFDRMLRATPGVVLEVHVLRERKLYENRKPWNLGTFFAQPWHDDDAPTHYFARFAGASCANYRIGDRALYIATGESAKLWPPERLSNFLDLQVLEPLPGGFSRVVAAR
jgi:hypothetical protein